MTLVGASVRSLVLSGATYALVVNLLDPAGMHRAGPRPSVEFWSAIAVATLVGVIALWRGMARWDDADDSSGLSDILDNVGDLGDVD